ncbi:DUF1178 family protein [Pseudophaeobacter arcticus]|uniref:DUF1178 family protein n=1 Tax=Pseudophaeobacter arcticus TaxID=385492 RepID=UPI00248F9109|nr:DUF1178 family protein [Pseudophaeobacter arcticus]
MINYSLKCAQGHSFDSWFQSASAFDKLAAAGLVACAFCGSTEVEKAIMAPRVRTGRKAVSGIGEPERNRPEVPELHNISAAAPSADNSAAVAVPNSGRGALSTPMSGQAAEMEKALSELRRKVEENSDYVGKDFASEARAMHLGDAPERAIYGEAKPEEAKALIEEGIPVLPLPFGRSRKTN